MRQMFHTLMLAALLTMAAAVPAAAQVILAPVPATTLIEFTHNGLNTDGYAIWIDGLRTVVTPTLVGTDQRRIGFPALTPGSHTIEFTAFVTVDGISYESAKSDTLTVRIVVVPARPGSPRVITAPLATNAPPGLRLITVFEDGRTHH